MLTELTQRDAEDIRVALLAAAAASVLSRENSPEALAKGLIQAFQLLDEATASPAGTGR